MSEPFIKLNMWMAKTGLNPSELIIFAVIHSFTESGGSYFGGISTLKEWTGCGERTVQNALKRLVSEGWVIVKRESRGRFSSEYVTNPAKIAGLNPAESAPQPRKNCTVNPAESAPNKIIDKININTPYSPPRRGTAHAGAKPERKRRTSGKRRRAVDIISSGSDYSTEGLRRMGISQGEEFYDSLDELRIE